MGTVSGVIKALNEGQCAKTRFTTVNASNINNVTRVKECRRTAAGVSKARVVQSEMQTGV